MKKNPEPIKALFMANILKKSTLWQIRAFEKSILEGKDDTFSGLCKSLKETDEMDAKMIQYLIDFIKTEHKINCKHPKKFHCTDPIGGTYCMKCGDDI